MIYSRNLGLHFPYLSLSFKVIFSLSNWQIQGRYSASKKDYESVSWSLVCTTFLKAPLHSFSCGVNRKYDLVAVRALTCSGIHVTYSALSLTARPCTVGLPEVCAPGHCECSMWMRRACTFPAYLCAPQSHPSLTNTTWKTKSKVPRWWQRAEH